MLATDVTGCSSTIYISKIINFIGWHEQRGFRAYRASRKSYQLNTTTRLAPRSLSAIYYYIIMENTFRFSSLSVFTFFFFLTVFLFPALPDYTTTYSAICLRPYIFSPVFPMYVAPGRSPVFKVLRLPCSDRNPSKPQWFFLSSQLGMKNTFYYVEIDRGDD